jgi:Ca2+-binding RTX toxin-like protein
MLEWSVADDAGAQTVLSTRVADPAVPPADGDTVMVAVPWTGTPEYFELADGRELQSFGATLRLLNAQDNDISPGPFDGSPDTLTTSFVSHGEGWSELVFVQNVPADMAYASLTDGRVLSVGETVDGKFVYQANLFNRPIDPGGGIVGTPALDLTLDVVFSDPDFQGFDANATYRWLSDGVVVGSNRTLTLTDALATRLEGRTLSVEVLYRGSAKMDYDIVRFGPTAPVSTDYPILTGTAADEVIRGSLQRDVIDGLGGNDTITGLDGNDTLTGGDGDDVMDGGPGTDTMTGGAGDDVMIGGTGDDTLDGGAGADLIRGGVGNDLIHAGPSDGRLGDTVFGESGNDTIYGSDGADSLNGQHDDDIIYGGVTENDLADTISGGVGDDWIDAGYGNDLCYGSWGDDTILGGFGADTLVGQVGDDLISGGALSDLIFGGDGNDFLNGGFGSDRLNGGAGADRFFHLGVADHGSDWIQDYDAAAGDVLMFGGAGATRAQFQVNTTETANAGTAGVDEAFVIHRPTGQILWALVDGGAQGAINIQIGAQIFDLLS